MFCPRGNSFAQQLKVDMQSNLDLAQHNNFFAQQLINNVHSNLDFAQHNKCFAQQVTVLPNS